MQLTVSDLMSQRPQCVADHATMDDALGALLEEQADEVFVTDDSGRLLGRVPEHRLLEWRLCRLPGDECVGAVVERDIPRVTPADRIESLVVLFQENKFRTVAVCDHTGLVGRIDRRDILRLMQTERALGGTSADDRLINVAERAPVPPPRFVKTRRTAGNRAAQR